MRIEPYAEDGVDGVAARGQAVEEGRGGSGGGHWKGSVGRERVLLVFHIKRILYPLTVDKRDSKISYFNFQGLFVETSL